MNFNNFTIKAQEVVQKAVQLTRTGGNQAVEPEHLLKGVMTEGEAVVRFIFQKLEINPAGVEKALEAALQRLPRVSGGEPYLSNDASKVLEKANDIASKNKDQYVTVETLLMALFEVKSSVSTMLKDAGMTHDGLSAAIDELRKGKSATSQSAEEQYNALSKYAVFPISRFATSRAKLISCVTTIIVMPD
ncbi:MAG: type VI secretion system ATPase TssH, partial [Muribaculaceae bacterium]|nr:type VI secretion system ATPase TssH [Muribaculaceae bacterium]